MLNSPEGIHNCALPLTNIFIVWAWVDDLAHAAKDVQAAEVMVINMIQWVSLET